MLEKGFLHSQLKLMKQLAPVCWGPTMLGWTARAGERSLCSSPAQRAPQFPWQLHPRASGQRATKLCSVPGSPTQHVLVMCMLSDRLICTNTETGEEIEEIARPARRVKQFQQSKPLVRSSSWCSDARHGTGPDMQQKMLDRISVEKSKRLCHKLTRSLFSFHSHFMS